MKTYTIHLKNGTTIVVDAKDLNQALSKTGLRNKTKTIEWIVVNSKGKKK
jgi:hypothetical protein